MRSANRLFAILLPLLASGQIASSQEVEIRIANAQEIVAALPDTSLAKDVLDEIDRDLFTIAFRRGDDGPSPQELTGQLIRLAAPEGVTNYNFTSRNGVATFRVGPVANFDAFVESIDYGTVVAQDASARIVRVKVSTDELDPGKLMARADSKGDQAGDELEDTLRGRRRARRSRDSDEPVPTDRLGADYATGDYVEIVVQGKPLVGTVQELEVGSFDRILALVQLTDTAKLQKLVKRSLRRRLDKTDSFAFWAPVERLRRLPEAPMPELEERTWTDLTGKYRVVGTYQRVEGDRVVLKLTSGRETKAPLAKLCDDDRAYVEALRATNENPFAAEQPPGRSLRADWTGVKQLRLKNSARWRWKPPSAAGPPVVSSSAARIDLDTPVGEGPFGSKLLDCVIAPDGGSAVAVFQSGHMTKTPHLQHVDLRTGETDELVDCPFPNTAAISQV